MEIATRHLQQNLDQLHLSATDIQDAVVNNQYVSKHNQVTHLYLLQHHQGIEVHNALININILKDGRILGIGNRFVSNLASRVNTKNPAISMQQAVQSVKTHFNISAAAPLSLLEHKGDKEAIFDATGLALEPITVKLVYQPMPDKSVRLAWNVVYYELDAQHWWNARVDAVTGKVLDYFDQVVHCDFEVEVCEEENTFRDSQLNTESVTLSPPNGNPSYNVFRLTIESPNHGERTLEINPANPVASPFGWHDTDGAEGPEYTITRGNNVHAYHDIFNQNSSVGGEPDGGDTLCFDFPLDLSQGRPYTQLAPSITNLFYWNNLMHDVWYQYGFDEVSGNFQFNNYDNGGEGDDYVFAEALDGSGTNNANFGTPADGGNPRMQMYLWGGSLPTYPDPQVQVTAPDTLIGGYDYARGGFGSNLPPTATPIISQVVLVDDNTGITSDACQPITNDTALVGKIAMIDRGDCEFGFKSLAAENAGAIAVIICNNVGDPIINMGAGDVGNQVTIPAIMISLADCNEIKMGLPDLTMQLAQPAFEVPNPGPSGRSSDFDNGVIAHEYTHGISNRLTGGPAAAGCLSNAEQAGEGWSDWFSLVMTNTADNTAEQARGIGTYADNQPITGPGIRPFPYSRDMNINPHTYADINNEAIPHGVGSVWCVMIWDLYWNLVDEYGYDEDLYHGTGGNNVAMQLVVDGLKMQSCDPTFIDARDAILAADVANYDGANQCLIWNTFARRGVGFSASAGGDEAFDLPDACNFTFRVKKTAVTEANAGETITYNLEITNGRSESISEAIVTDQLPAGTTFIGSSDCDITENNGVLSISLGTVTSGTVINCSYQVQLAAVPFTYTTFEDDAEAGDDNWNFVNPAGTATWTLTPTNVNSGSFSFFAPNPGAITDQQLVLSAPHLLNGPNPTLSFWHFYNTETNWDGGVVEISTDGNSWDDLGGQMISNGYDGALNINADNVLSGRPAFHGDSGDWINTIVDLSSYAGQEVLLRFRLGSDGSVAGQGWFVDDIQFLGDFYAVTNTACVDNAGEDLCSSATTIVIGENPNATQDLNPNLGVALFPNPSTGSFTISMLNPGIGVVDVKVMSIDGRELLKTQFDAGQTKTVDLSAYGAGVYLVQLGTDTGILVRKMVVE
ncbi:MAG: hypothetical protein DHS20C18_33510 [Saprospiraceae bacterium]|nr:MAG: hypothetical protein DHS20C18_33510 [Saprospiraceae bacterium]